MGMGKVKNGEKKEQKKRKQRKKKKEERLLEEHSGEGYRCLLFNLSYLWLWKNYRVYKPIIGGSASFLTCFSQYVHVKW